MLDKGKHYGIFGIHRMLTRFFLENKKIKCVRNCASFAALSDHAIQVGSENILVIQMQPEISSEGHLPLLLVLVHALGEKYMVPGYS